MRPAGGRPEGTVTLTAVESGRMWASEAGIPFGRLRSENRYEPLADGKIRVSKRVEVHGPFGPLFHLIWESRMRADMHKSFAALEAEAARRAEPRGESTAAAARVQDGAADTRDEGEPADPFGSNEHASHPEPRGPLMSPGFWLHHAALAWRQVFDRRLRPLSLTPTQFMLLASAGWLTATSGRPPTQQEVADHAGADRMMTSKVLQTLVDRGLVSRQPDPADGRVRRLRLTPEGRDLVRRGIRIAVDLDEEMFGPGGDPLRETLQYIAARARAAS